ncbi:hypothetical protein OVA11_14225 [Caulobacter sp. SL161]|uniref:hypothetical protein n=1 Tax=Caulobacter sp. SL161 TaxID=2995156 RepID=UPI0022723065|nr:hypothetical protein [Caulobacter sp. SL161]MCY1648177.1 hypothetical protein [Caulobacter sp. SL161]
MRIRLTKIALHHDGRTFDEGAVVEGVTLADGDAFAEDEIPAELAEARVAAGSAELVIDGVTTVSAAASAAIAQMVASVAVARAAAVAVLDAAEAGDDSDKLALAETMREISYDLAEDQRDRWRAFQDQLGEIQERVAKAAAEKPKRRRGQTAAA